MSQSNTSILFFMMVPFVALASSGQQALTTDLDPLASSSSASSSSAVELDELDHQGLAHGDCEPICVPLGVERKVEDAHCGDDHKQDHSEEGGGHHGHANHDHEDKDYSCHRDTDILVLRHNSHGHCHVYKFGANGKKLLEATDAHKTNAAFKLLETMEPHKESTEAAVTTFLTMISEGLTAASALVETDDKGSDFQLQAEQQKQGSEGADGADDTADKRAARAARGGRFGKKGCHDQLKPVSP